MNDSRKPGLSLALFIAAALWCGALFYLSGQSGAQSAALSLRFTRWLLRALPFLPQRPDALEPILRKCAHFGIFAVEGALLGGAFITLLSRRLRGALLAALSCAAIAALNEYHQSFSIGRSCEFRDMLIDAAGGAVGVLLAALALSLARRFAARIRARRNML